MDSNTSIKEMKYKKKREFHILAKEVFKNWLIVVVSMGTHPCLYIGTKDKIKENLIRSRKRIDFAPIVNAGYNECNFSGNGLGVSNILKHYWFLGWSYDHLEDFVTNCAVFSCGKKWTTKELLKHGRDNIKEVEEELVEIEIISLQSKAITNYLDGVGFDIIIKGLNKEDKKRYYKLKRKEQ